MGDQGLQERHNPGRRPSLPAPVGWPEILVPCRVGRDRGLTGSTPAEMPQGSGHSRHRTGTHLRFHGRNECMCARNE
jgi:hypothetical protein